MTTAHQVSAEEAHDIGVDAYIYLYPLLLMDITRKQLTNSELAAESGRGPMNIFVNVPAYPPADFKGVVRSNFDTLYSLAWLDLTREPLVVSAPDTDGRFYLLPMLDMWTDVFASPGWRPLATCHLQQAGSRSAGRTGSSQGPQRAHRQGAVGSRRSIIAEEDNHECRGADLALADVFATLASYCCSESQA